MKISKEGIDLGRSIIKHFNKTNLAPTKNIPDPSEKENYLDEIIKEKPSESTHGFGTYDKWANMSKIIDAKESEMKVQEDIAHKDKYMEQQHLQGLWPSIDHSKENILFEKPTEEKLDAASRFNLEGNEALQEENYTKASYYYSQANVQFVYTFPSIPEEQARYDDLQLKCYLNMALCKLKQGIYDQALQHCNSALKIDPTNIKGLYRRAKLYIIQTDFELADLDIHSVLKIEPRNTQALSLKTELEQKKREYKDESKKIYTTMVDKLGNDGDKHERSTIKIGELEERKIKEEGDINNRIISELVEKIKRQEWEIVRLKDRVEYVEMGLDFIKDYGFTFRQRDLLEKEIARKLEGKEEISTEERKKPPPIVKHIPTTTTQNILPGEGNNRNSTAKREYSQFKIMKIQYICLCLLIFIAIFGSLLGSLLLLKFTNII